MRLDCLKGLKCIVFDCDGVLIDSYDANMRYYGMVKETLGLPPLTPDEKVYVHSHTHKEGLEYITPEDRFEDAWKFQEGFHYKDLLPYLKLSDGLHELLWWLRDAGFLMAVNTSRTDTMPLILNQFDLEPYFHPVITSADVRRPKPNAEGMHRIMAKLNVEAHEIAFIGDTAVDMRTARNSGVRFWAYGDELLDADVHISDFWTLRRLLHRAYEGAGRII